MLAKKSSPKRSSQLKANQERGFISLLVLLVTFFLSWIGMMTFMKVSSQERIVQYEAIKTQVAYAADSGLEIAEAQLSANTKWTGGVYDVADCEVCVCVEPQSEQFYITVSAQTRNVRQCRYGTLISNQEGEYVLSNYGILYE
ncbi:hypothetical protein LPY66_12495 [Dehalobacter sp. DCM]|uniref:hypothetical protein n=1 Tax=Dehalobacter sp. DCM TaxID=2907827 RepID=UPI003081F23E|nr:hypothetical protein LPY66_12495 [Dehalobacter sp. DCM]